MSKLRESAVLFAVVLVGALIQIAHAPVARADASRAGTS
jgi:hypothetical protein